MRTFRSTHRFAVLFVMTAIIVAGILCSCGTTTPEPTKKELLTRAGGWKFDKFTVGDVGALAVAYPGMVIKFAPSGVMTITPTSEAVAAAKALTVDIQSSVIGSWEFNLDETQITLILPPLFASQQRVAELTSTTLRLTGSNILTMQPLESRWTGN